MLRNFASRIAVVEDKKLAKYFEHLRGALEVQSGFNWSKLDKC